MQAESGITRQKVLLTPSTCCESSPDWSIEDVITAGLLDTYGNMISHLAVQRYPKGRQCFLRILKATPLT